MYYALITLASLLFSLQFVMNNGYQRADGASWGAALRFSLYSSLVGILLLFAINSFHLRFTWFSLAVAFVYALICIGLNFCSVRAFEHANLSMYSVFSMIGGMVIPFLYGMGFCGEEVRPLRIVCCAFMAVSVVLSVEKSTAAKGALKYYLGVFILNGAVGAVSKFHQSHPESVESADFLMLAKLVTVALSILLLLLQKDRHLVPSGKALAFASGFAVLSSIGNLFLLISLYHLPASVQYPVVTGGVIVFSTAIDLIVSRKLQKRKVLSALVALAASVLMI
ncbi:MAG TPA: hypothetical protein DDW30_07165 [Clostridiales bacterium]|nr:hypothetical protein [Clostridiales bacterium]